MASFLPSSSLSNRHGLQATALIPSSLLIRAPQLLILLVLQYILTLLLPPAYAFLLAIAFLLGIALTTQPTRSSAPPGPNPEDYVKDIRMGRWTAQPSLVGNEEDEGENGK